MVATNRQIEANRRNAQLSTGPRSDEGKAVARGNALKHGLAGTGVVIHEDETVKINERMAAYASAIGPISPLECFTVEQLAIEAVRIERAQRDERILLIRRGVWAENGWDEDRRLAAEEIGARLASDPARTVSRLRQSTQGCDWLIDRWQGLAHALQPGRVWDADQSALALDLLGFPTPVDPASCDDANAEANAPQAALAADQVELLQQLKTEVMDSRDAMEREIACNGVGPGDAATERALALTRRYEAACQRRFERMLKLLASGDLNSSTMYRPAREAVAEAQARQAERRAALQEASQPEPEPEPEHEPAAWTQVAASTEPTTSAPPQPTFPEPVDDHPRGNRRWRKEQERRARELAR